MEISIFNQSSIASLERQRGLALPERATPGAGGCGSAA